MESVPKLTKIGQTCFDRIGSMTWVFLILQFDVFLTFFWYHFYSHFSTTISTFHWVHFFLLPGHQRTSFEQLHQVGWGDELALSLERSHRCQGLNLYDFLYRIVTSPMAWIKGWMLIDFAKPFVGWSRNLQVFALVTSDLYDPTPVPIRGKSDEAMEIGCSKKMRLSETFFWGDSKTFILQL